MMIDTLVIRNTSFHNIPVNGLCFSLRKISNDPITKLTIYDRKGHTTENIIPFLNKIEKEIKRYDRQTRQNDSKPPLLDNITIWFPTSGAHPTEFIKRNKTGWHGNIVLNQKATTPPNYEGIRFKFKLGHFGIKFFPDYSEHGKRLVLPARTFESKLKDLYKILKAHKARCDLCCKIKYLEHPKKITIIDNENRKHLLELNAEGYKENPNYLTFYTTDDFDGREFIEQKRHFPNIKFIIFCTPRHKTTANNLWSQLDGMKKENFRGFNKLQNTLFGAIITDEIETTHFIFYNKTKGCWINRKKKNDAEKRIRFKKSPKKHQAFCEKSLQKEYNQLKIMLPRPPKNFFETDSLFGNEDLPKKSETTPDSDYDPLQDFANSVLEDFEESKKREKAKKPSYRDNLFHMDLTTPFDDTPEKVTKKKKKEEEEESSSDSETDESNENTSSSDSDSESSSDTDESPYVM